MPAREKVEDLDAQLARYDQLIAAWQAVERDVVAEPRTEQAQQRLESFRATIVALERSRQAARERRALIMDPNRF